MRCCVLSLPSFPFLGRGRVLTSIADRGHLGFQLAKLCVSQPPSPSTFTCRTTSGTCGRCGVAPWRWPTCAARPPTARRRRRATSSETTTRRRVGAEPGSPPSSRTSPLVPLLSHATVLPSGRYDARPRRHGACPPRACIFPDPLPSLLLSTEPPLACDMFHVRSSNPGCCPMHGAAPLALPYPRRCGSPRRPRCRRA